MGLFNKEPKTEYEYINCHINYEGYEDFLFSLPKYGNDDYSLNKKDFVDAVPENEKVYKYEYVCKNPELIPEVNDKGEKVIRATIDGNTVGYIKKGSVAMVNNHISNGRIVGISADFLGGNYKKHYTYYSNHKSDYVTEVEIVPSDYYDLIFTLELFPKEGTAKLEGGKVVDKANYNSTNKKKSPYTVSDGKVVIGTKTFSAKQLKRYKTINLILGIFMCLAGLSLLPLGIIFILIGIVELYLYRTYRNALADLSSISN